MHITHICVRNVSDCCGTDDTSSARAPRDVHPSALVQHHSCITLDTQASQLPRPQPPARHQHSPPAAAGRCLPPVVPHAAAAAGLVVLSPQLPCAQPPVWPVELCVLPCWPRLGNAAHQHSVWKLNACFGSRQHTRQHRRQHSAAVQSGTGRDRSTGGCFTWQ